MKFTTQHSSIRKLVRAAVIAALYMALSIVFAPISFSSVQVRISEALTLLPILCPEAVIGVTVGCFLSNLLFSTPIDMVVGTLATLLAALATRKLRRFRFKGLALVGSLPPVLFNAVIVGIELTLLYNPGSGAGMYAFNMLTVGIGQVISCCVLGVLLVWGIEKKPALLRFFSDEQKPFSL